MKIIVYADSVRDARRYYPGKPDESVGHRAARDFDGPEKADLVIYAKDYPEIQSAYEDKLKKKKKDGI